MDLVETKTETSNATTGAYSMDFLHDDQTGAAGAYFKMEEQWTDPLSGSYESSLFLLKLSIMERSVIFVVTGMAVGEIVLLVKYIVQNVLTLKILKSNAGVKNE